MFKKLAAGIVVIGFLLTGMPVYATGYHSTSFATAVDNTNFGGAYLKDQNVITFYDHSVFNSAYPALKWVWEFPGAISDNTVTYTTFTPSVTVTYPKVNAIYQVSLATYDANGANTAQVSLNLSFTNPDPAPTPLPVVTPTPAPTVTPTPVPTPTPTPTPTVTFPAGCTSTSGYSTTTGTPCNGSTPVPTPTPSTVIPITPVATFSIPGCDSLLGYSTVNGQPCSGASGSWATPSSSLTTLSTPSASTGDSFTQSSFSSISAPVLPAGCTSDSGYSTVTQESCSGIEALSYSAALPQGCTSDSGYSITTGTPCSTVVSMSTPVPDSTAVAVLPAGCSSASSGYSTVTGKACATSSADTVSPNAGSSTNVPSCSITAITKLLQKGQTGDQVRSLQTILSSQGYLPQSAITGTFTSKTVVALKALQKAYNVLITGYTGSTVRPILNQLLQARCAAK
jgi:hypothetical protein